MRVDNEGLVKVNRLNGYGMISDIVFHLCQIQSNINGSNIFGTMEIHSRHGYCEPLRVNHSTCSGSR